MILAALGPRMLELARGRAGGAYPYLVSTAYVRQAKGMLGPDRALAVLVLVAFEPDRARAREVMGPTLESFADSPAYRANVSRMGFEEGELSGARTASSTRSRSGDRMTGLSSAWPPTRRRGPTRSCSEWPTATAPPFPEGSGGA